MNKPDEVMMKRYFIFLFFLASFNRIGFTQTDSTSIITGWQLFDNYSNSTSIVLDTNLTDFQRFYPNYSYSISNSYLGNLGSPSLSNVFSDRIFNDDVFFLNSYLSYFYTAENTKYYNTKKPFSSLTYNFVIPTRTLFSEESFKAFFTQNITPELNFAMLYHNESARGHYNYTQVRNNSFRLNASYRGQRYMAHSSFNVNRYWNYENGGIDDEFFEKDEYTFRTEIPTKFGGTGAYKWVGNAKNSVRYYDFMLSQRLKLFTIASKVDSAELDKGRNIAEPVLSYVFNARRVSKNYKHDDPTAPDFYDQVYFNSTNTLDSIANLRISNSLRLEFKTTFRRKVQVGAYGSLGNDFDKYSYYSLWDTLHNPWDTIPTLADSLVRPHISENGDTLRGIDKANKMSSTYFSAGLYGNFWNRVKAHFSTKVYFLGQKSGQTELKGLLNTNITLFKNDFEFDIQANFLNKKPSYLFQNYYSNHYIWNQDQQQLFSEKWTNLSGKISAPSNRFELTGNYYLISDFIYFNQEAKPVNYSNTINILSVEVSKTFKLWELYSENIIVYQASENKTVLPLPDLVFFNSTYLDHTFHFKSTGGEVQTIMGMDTYYTTDFYGYEYSPALAQFYVQENQYIGNFPMMDAYLNIKLNRVRFYFKVQHFNSSWFEQKYYSAIHYPYKQRSYQLGLSWAFYD